MLACIFLINLSNGSWLGLSNELLCILAGQGYANLRDFKGLETVAKKMRLANKDVNSKKSTILIQIAWDSGNVTYSWASHFDKVA